MTEIHDSNTCKLGADDEACEMCARASKSPSLTYHGHPRLDTGLEYAPAEILAGEAKNVSEASLTQSRAIPAPAFDSEWEAAPRGRRARVEREDAEWWFERGHASDTEQLIRLRQSAGNALEWIAVQAETWTCQHADQPMRCSRCSLRLKAQDLTSQLREALQVKAEYWRSEDERMV